MQTFSQNREQEFIFNYFGDFVGNFMDLGSNDGITLSNTWALALHGWHGILVDASPKAFERLKKNYEGNERVVLLNCAVGSIKGDMVLSESGELLGQGDVALVSSFKYEETKRWESINMPFENVIVPMVRFEEILEKAGSSNFDLISIDIEGMEKEVVPQIDFAALKTRMAIIEFNGKDEDFFTNHMNQFGFKLIHKNAENLIYTI